MKIGILTFHCAHNYGAVLQAFGLQQYLSQLGNEVEIINYQPTYLTQIYNLFSINRFFSMAFHNKIRYILTEPIAIRRKYKRYRKFENFIHTMLTLSPEKLIHPHSIKGYDYIFFGSDQIWNPKLTHGFDPIYMGDFQSNAHFIAYAPSMETAQLSHEEQNKYIHYLKKFKAVSVREIKLKELLQPLTDKKIELVCDPTFLLDSSQWNYIAGEAPLIKEKYILVYQTRTQKKVLNIAKKIAKEKNCKIIRLSACFY